MSFLTISLGFYCSKKILLLDVTPLIVFDHVFPEVILITCQGSTPIFFEFTLKLSTGMSVSFEYRYKLRRAIIN
jgi:hypothetical protein